MITDLVATLRLNIEEESDLIKYVFAQRDGLSLSDDLKPFVTVRYEYDDRTALSAGRRSKDVTYTFQVGVFARTYAELLLMSEEVSGIIDNSEGLPLVKADGTETDQSVFFDVSDFTPIYNDKQEDKTNNNRGYFTVSARLLLTEGTSEFTQ